MRKIIQISVFIIFVFFLGSPYAQAKQNTCNYDISKYEEIIKQNPGTDKAMESYLAIGFINSYVVFEKYKEAIAAYLFIADNYPKSKYADDALWFLAELYKVNMEDFEKALEIYERLYKDYDDVTFEIHPIMNEKPADDMSKEDLQRKVLFLKLNIKLIREIIKDIERINNHNLRKDMYFQLVDKYIVIGALKMNEELLNNMIVAYLDDPYVSAKAFFFKAEINFNYWTDRLKTKIGKYIYDTTCKTRLSSKTTYLYKALDNYNFILESFPNSEFVDSSLMKTGIIYATVDYEELTASNRFDVEKQKLENYKKAKEAFKKIVYDRSKSEFNEEARKWLQRMNYRIDNMEPEK